MILIGMGANLPSPVYGSPKETLKACLETFQDHGMSLIACSSWYESAPVPISDQPWYVNGVVRITTKLEARALLETLLEIEQSFGRVREELNAPRILDLDLIAYNREIHEDRSTSTDKPFCVPHPRLQDRAFVLHPLMEIAPDWQHPKTGQSVQALVAGLPSDQIIRILAD